MQCLKWVGMILGITLLATVTFAEEISGPGETACGTVGPEAVTDVYNISKNTSVNIFWSTLLQNDIDPDTSPLIFWDFRGPSTGSICGFAPNGFCWQPPANFVGLVSFPYAVSDGCKTSWGTVLINVKP